jgi:hypothetical protein
MPAAPRYVYCILVLELHCQRVDVLLAELMSFYQICPQCRLLVMVNVRLSVIQFINPSLGFHGTILDRQDENMCIQMVDSLGKKRTQSCLSPDIVYKSMLRQTDPTTFKYTRRQHPTQP